MFTYQVRKRTIRLLEKKAISFPAKVSLVFYMQPLQPFGCSKDGGKTAVENVAASVFFNANTGHHHVASVAPLKPLDVKLEETNRTLEIKGNKFFITTEVLTLLDLDMLVNSIFFCFPILLNVDFADPPIIERVDGTINNIPFRWELNDWNMTAQITSQNKQEKRIVGAWDRFDIISNPANRRLVAAIQYFHVFARLTRAGQTPWEFMSEAIVNLSKVLESLFPPQIKKQGSIDAARIGLEELGYESSYIEKNLIPAIALRNNIDSGHVDLSIFTLDQLTVLQTYTESVESIFRDLLSKIFEKIEAGTYSVVPYKENKHRRDAAKIIERLKEHGGSHA
ncbi:MAG TPA: hypothetical protein ENI76_00435 [Ignavibacteria bacterium]|nr:hypothetical protein [Ignavibacteria bacterium]